MINSFTAKSRFICFIFIVFVNSITFSQNSTKEYLADLHGMYASAERYFKDGEDSLGMESLDSIIGYVHDLKKPFSDKLWSREMELLYHSSLQLLEKEGGREPLSLYYTLLGIYYGETNNYQQAVSNISRSLEIDSSNWVVFHSRAMYYRKLNNLEAAVKDYTSALTISPFEPDILNNRGYAYTHMGKYREAKMDYFTVLTFAKNNLLIGYTYSNLAYVFYLEKAYDMAEEYIKMSINAYPENPYVYRNKGLLDLALERNKEACSSFEKAIEFGYSNVYGTEVEELLKIHCK